jgi:hypothetical protein
MKVPIWLFRVAPLVFATAIAVNLFFLWQPERQVELHTLNLLKRVSSRDWPEVASMMGPDYRDAWGQDRDQAVDRARLLLSHFFSLRVIAVEPMKIRLEEGRASAAARLGVFGSGTGLAEAVMEEVRATEDLFVFLWRKEGRWPWQWVLVEAGNRTLETYRPIN